jgi:hypothetical protein
MDAASWALNDDRARAIVAAAFQQGIVTYDDMVPVLDRLVRPKRHALIVTAIADAAGGVESIAEQDFLRLCRRGHLPRPVCQSVVPDASGRRRLRDAYFEEWRVHVEVDGSHHMDVANWWADMRRQNEMWTSGDRVLRFPAWAVRAEPDVVIDQVRRALIAAGWRPPAR